MRATDYQLTSLIRRHWAGDKQPRLCPLLSNLPALLQYLDARDFHPGDAIMVCPECGDHHRWTFLRELMLAALDIRPKMESVILERVDRSLDSVRAEFGGEERYREYLRKADAYFAKIGANANLYKL